MTDPKAQFSPPSRVTVATKTGRWSPVSTVTEIGAAVRAQREAMNLDQASGAALAGVGVRFLSELERGMKSSVHMGKALQVLAAFGLAVGIRRRR